MPPISLEPGYRLDRYELLCKIGQGGMASVWLARAQGKHGFERLVAVKTVLPEHAADQGFRAMLLDEARIAAAIDHPNVARILDVGEDRDVPFMVLEYISGDSLIRLHRKLAEAGKRIPPEIVIRVLADACTGLHMAHELKDASGKLLGIVHRDVSPQNILVNELGIVKLIDFGVAKATGRLAAETATGIIKGKVPYMAPEQALGVPVDQRADIWAMGSVAYFLLAGNCPFDGPNDAARVIRAVTGERPDPLPASVPSGLSDVIMRALAREPANRQATAAELRAAFLASATSAATEDVAAFFAENLADQAKARKKMLDRALAAAAQREQARAQLTFEPVPGSTSDPRVALAEDVTTTGTIARAVATKAAESARPRRWLLGAVGGGVAALVGAGFLVGAFASRGSAATGAAAVEPAKSAPVPTLEESSRAEAPSAMAPTTAPIATASVSAKVPATGAISAVVSSAPPIPSAKPAAKPSATVARPPTPPKPKSTDDTIF
jgi:serine/threonine-protein kinase